MRITFCPWHLAVGILALPLLGFSQSFDFNEKCKAAYNEVFSLRLESGKAFIAEEEKQHPENLIPLLLENYIDFLNVIITGDESQLAVFKTNKNKRIGAIKKGDPHSPWFRHALAETYLQYALAAFLFREYFSGLMELRKAYSLLEENVRRFPDFKPGRKSYLIVKSLLGVIPEKYNWGLWLFGMSGNLEEGMMGLKQLTTSDWGHDKFLKEETVLTYALLLLHLEGKRKEAWETVSETFPIEGNLFSYYAAIKIALYSHHNREVLNMLEHLPGGNAYAQIPVMEYYKGLAHLQDLDDAATVDFQKFLDDNKGQQLIKSANHKIAWAYLIKGDSEGYRNYMDRVKEQGVTQTDADKQAQCEAENKVAPNPELLKARLLFDGGYFEKALQILENIPFDSIQQKQYQLEYIYRQARIFDEMGDTVRAIEKYMMTLNEGAKEPFYYAANAALNLGFIYEAKGNNKLAKAYFIECLKMDDHEYKNSLAQKAKAGLERLELATGSDQN